MIRAALKGTGLWVFGRIPGGTHFYRKFTREWLGTQSSHVEKLMRVVPGYVPVWKQCGTELEGAEIAVLNSGMLTFWPMACRLITGAPSHHLQLDERMIPQYNAFSRQGVLDSLGGQFPNRATEIAALKETNSVGEILARCQAKEHLCVRPEELPLEDESVDIVHSGGTLEHFSPGMLRSFLKESLRVIKPGGISSHIIDHRDHLYHADKGIEPMNHLRHSEIAYRFMYGHPLLFHNRLNPSELVGMICEAGFEKLMVRRMILPSGKYVPDEQVLSGILGCSRPAPRFRKMSGLDLHTAACHCLFQKPK